MSDLVGKIAFVTGSASGIGRASALRLASDGADIGLIDLNVEGVEETARQIETTGRSAFPVMSLGLLYW